MLVIFGLVITAVGYSDALRLAFLPWVGLLMFAAGAWWIFRWQTAPERFRTSEAGQVALQAFERAKGRWVRAYYCQKDDVAFVPGEPSSCTPPDFQSWLTE